MGITINDTSKRNQKNHISSLLFIIIIIGIIIVGVVYSRIIYVSDIYRSNNAPPG